MDNKKKGRKKSNIIWSVMTIAFLVVAIVCAGTIALEQYRRWKSEALFEELANATNETTTAETTTSAETTETESTQPQLTGRELTVKLLYDKYGITVPEKNIDFENLHETVSEDIYAWIYIPNTNVDYPVLQHPTDNTYYLEYNLDGSKGYPGCIYTENYNNKEFTDKHTVIYGHNMRDGTMFSDLHMYEDEEFFNNNPYVYIYTEDNVFVYQIYAAYESGNTHLLLGYDYSTDEKYLNYLNYILEFGKQKGYTNSDIVFEADDKILSLSTCVMAERQTHIRYLVQGVLLDVE